VLRQTSIKCQEEQNENEGSFQGQEVAERIPIQSSEFCYDEQETKKKAGSNDPAFPGIAITADNYYLD
jgi:hypothetical protein